jgi:spore coat polysaccharide biosynthesis protein SpsF
MGNRIIAIVQARMGSQRFPGKMMADLNGRPLIDWVLRRTARSQLVTETVLATTVLAEDDQLVEVAEAAGIPVVRGSSPDVLGRYALAAKSHSADTVVRICADRPLVDPAVVDSAVRAFGQQATDLAFNHISEGVENWPRGFGAEVLSANLLYWLAENVTDFHHREHVTLYLWQHRNDYRIQAAPCPEKLNPGFANLLFDVDQSKDLDKLRLICNEMDQSATAENIVKSWQTLKANKVL